MIELTRLNGHKIAVNCDLIRYAEASPDTVLTLITGEKLIVLESCVSVFCKLLCVWLRLFSAYMAAMLFNTPNDM